MDKPEDHRPGIGWVVSRSEIPGTRRPSRASRLVSLLLAPDGIGLSIKEPRTPGKSYGAEQSPWRSAMTWLKKKDPRFGKLRLRTRGTETDLYIWLEEIKPLSQAAAMVSLAPLPPAVEHLIEEAQLDGEPR
jgi:hypothetical protein